MVALYKSKNHFNPYLAGKWTVPGGKLEVGEKPVDGAVREMMEETGLDVCGRLKHVLSMPCNCLPDTEPEHTLHIYACELDQSVIANARTMEDEDVLITNWRNLSYNDWVRYTEPLIMLCQIRLRNN